LEARAHGFHHHDHEEGPSLDDYHDRGLSKEDVDEGLVQDIEIKDKSGKKFRGVRCAAKHDKKELRRMLREQSSSRLLQVPGAPVNLKVKFQVVTDNAGTGDVSNSALVNQMAVLNATFASSMFTFTMDPATDIVRRRNTTYYTGCYTQRDAMRQLWAIDVTRYINVYICSPGGGILGSSTFPNSPSGQNNTRHGIIVNRNTLPGGSFAAYNQGKTLTHELGHYLGLLHTFQGGCGATGDRVDDTPSQNTSTYGCPAGKDTCAGLPGLDPITNYMDYSDDPCMTEFSPGQAQRMHSETSLYRPILYQSL
jgi:hypothetical protein